MPTGQTAHVSQVPSVDPNARQAFPVRAVRAAIRTKPGTKMAMIVSANVDPWLLSHSNGRIDTGVGFPTVNVTTIGRKSGQKRTATLVYFTQGDDVVLVASSFGRDKHPAWYLNLKANPEAELLSKGRGGTYVAREAEGEERDRLFALAEKVYAGYGSYQAGTDRKIPVMVLTPARGAA
jgi:deazaflavin-dependent oxidoreductase (nitroreductase family)